MIHCIYRYIVFCDTLYGMKMTSQIDDAMLRQVLDLFSFCLVSIHPSTHHKTQGTQKIIPCPTTRKRYMVSWWKVLSMTFSCF